MDQMSYLTPGGVRVRRVAEPFDPAGLADLTRQVQDRRGGVLSSGMEYPGRYSRWHLAYVDPPVEIAAWGRRIRATALNDRGRVLLPVIAAALARAGTPRRTGPPAQRRGAHPRVRRGLYRGAAEQAAHGVLRDPRDHGRLCRR